MRYFIIMMLLLSTILGCNEAAMSGSGGKKQSGDVKKQESKKVTKRSKPDDAPKADANQGKDGEQIETLPDTSTVDQGKIGEEKIADGLISPAIVPDEIVDGQEVINDCRRCEERAKQLSPQAGFQADIKKTFNEGFYKVDPSRGICDIHWMADMNVRIADHDGIDSVLDRQVALYCPCNCGWAKEDFGPKGPPGPGYGYGNGGANSQNAW